MLPGSGFFRPKSLKSLDFLGPVCFRISSFNDFLNGGFFSLIMYILILFINKVKRLCHQNHHRFWSDRIIHICCGLYLYHPLDVVAWCWGQSSAHPLSIEVSVPWFDLTLLFFWWAGLVFAPAYTIIIWSEVRFVNHFLHFGPIFFWLYVVVGGVVRHKRNFAHRERTLL